MVAKATIVSEINTKVGGNHPLYRIGITNDPVERKKHWTGKEDTTYWKQWQADSLSDAQAIETYFIQQKKMKGGEGGDVSAQTRWVYVF
jgi:hypothetical protein